MKPDFKNDLSFGESREAKLFELTNGLLKRNNKKNPRDPDFITPSGQLLELKSERYPFTPTCNLGLEIISNQNTGALGGPLRSEAEGVFYYAHLMSNDVLLIFETMKIAAMMKSQLFKNDALIDRPMVGFFNEQKASNRTKNWIVPYEHLRPIVLREIVLGQPSPLAAPIK